MRKLKIEIELENSSFEDPTGYEVTVLLNHIAERVRNEATEGKLRDTNGNTCGKWAIIGK